jgi:hypothetical protein
MPALGRRPPVMRSVKRDDVDPATFGSKLFLAEVGFKSTSSDGRYSEASKQKRKEDDFLRVHSLREKISENPQTHMVPYDTIRTQKHVFDSDIDTEASTPTEAPGLRTADEGKTNDKRPKGHASDATLAPSTAAAPASSHVGPAGIVRIWGGGRLTDAQGNPKVCEHCGGEKIVPIIEADGRESLSCHSCGRRIRKKAAS